MKGEKRIPVHFTLSLEMTQRFNKFCDDKDVNKSRLIEWLLLQHIADGEKGVEAVK